MLLQIFKYNFFWIMLICCACTNENISIQKDMTKSSDFSVQNNDLTTFHKSGYGSIYLGGVYDASKFKQVSEELGGCFNASSLDFSGISITVENNIISEISTDDPSVLSYDGIKVGDPISLIEDKVDLNALEIIQNDYTNLPVFIHWHDKNKAVGTRYSTDDGIIIHYIDMGLSERMYLLEGCA